MGLTQASSMQHGSSTVNIVCDLSDMCSGASRRSGEWGDLMSRMRIEQKTTHKMENNTRNRFICKLSQTGSACRGDRGKRALGGACNIGDAHKAHAPGGSRVLRFLFVEHGFGEDGAAHRHMQGRAILDDNDDALNKVSLAGRAVE